MALTQVLFYRKFVDIFQKFASEKFKLLILHKILEYYFDQLQKSECIWKTW